MNEGAEARLIASPGLGRERLARLQRGTVAVIGAGVLGGQVSYHLGLLGVGQVLVDHGRVEPHNFSNQGFALADLGEWKTVARARRIAALNPDAAVQLLTSRVEDLGLAALAGVDLLVTGVDGRAARVRASTIAWRLQIPWVDAAVDGSGRMLRGTVTLYDPCDHRSPCYMCRLDANALHAISREGRGPGCPNPLRPDVVATPPTLQASAFASVIAGYQTLWATRALLGEHHPLVARQLVVSSDGLPETRLLTMTRAAHCRFDHRPFGRLHRLQGDRLADLLAAANAAFDAPADEFVLHDRAFVAGLRCLACGAVRDAVRIVGAYSEDDIRCSCRTHAEMTAIAIRESLPAAEAPRLVSRTWSQLGMPVGEVITARRGTDEIHFVVNPASGGWTDA